MSDFISGNYGLAKTYWLFGIIGNIVMGLIVTFLIISGVEPMVALLIAVCYSLVVWIAVWNSSSKYEGLKLWALLAKVSVVFGILSSMAQFNQ